jgi:hypothetical protein
VGVSDAPIPRKGSAASVTGAADRMAARLPVGTRDRARVGTARPTGVWITSSQGCDGTVGGDRLGLWRCSSERRGSPATMAARPRAGGCPGAATGSGRPGGLVADGRVAACARMAAGGAPVHRAGPGPAGSLGAHVSDAPADGPRHRPGGRPRRLSRRGAASPPRRATASPPRRATASPLPEGGRVASPGGGPRRLSRRGAASPLPEGGRVASPGGGPRRLSRRGAASPPGDACRLPRLGWSRGDAGGTQRSHPGPRGPGAAGGTAGTPGPARRAR